MTLKKLTLFAAVLMLLGNCAAMGLSIETETALCDEWGAGLFLPSRSDTHETATGLTEQIKVHESVCGGLTGGGDWFRF